MLNWMIGTCDLFGLQAQNWMLVFAGILVLYVAVLVVSGRHQPRV